MDAATINVRLPLTLKEYGGQVLDRHGISVSTAVRKLYEYLNAEQDIPEWMQEDVEEDKYEQRRRGIRDLVGVIKVPHGYNAKAEYREHLDNKYEGLISS